MRRINHLFRSNRLSNCYGFCLSFHLLRFQLRIFFLEFDTFASQNCWLRIDRFVWKKIRIHIWWYISKRNEKYSFVIWKIEEIFFSRTIIAPSIKFYLIKFIGSINFLRKIRVIERKRRMSLGEQTSLTLFQKVGSTFTKTRKASSRLRITKPKFNGKATRSNARVNRGIVEAWRARFWKLNLDLWKMGFNFPLSLSLSLLKGETRKVRVPKPCDVWARRWGGGGSEDREVAQQIFSLSNFASYSTRQNVT